MKWVDAAPWLIVGLVAAGLMRQFFPTHLVQRWLGGPGFMPTIRASLIGTPLPMCSCSVLPAAIQLSRSGASRGATVSFLIATPENGIDSLMMSWGMLGPKMTCLRLAGALISSISAGCLTTLVDRWKWLEKKPEAPSSEEMQAASTSEGVSLLPVLQNFVPPKPAPAPPSNRGMASLIRETGRGLEYAFGNLLRDIVVWICIGIVTAALVDVFVPPSAMAAWGRGPWVPVLVLLVSVPAYVCASGSTPIAGSLLTAGLSPGAVLVFLLAGPASNFSSAGIIRRELGGKALACYLTGVMGITLILGWSVDLLWQQADLVSPAVTAGHQHNNEVSVVVHFAAGLLLFRMVWLQSARVFSRVVFGRSA
ncbi:MAG: SO_0444 family Cu/Zn efflux transporter [Planctomyces sp.]|jgi:uncharacterized membrane protein YraQ (UPF0718 family)